VARPLGCPRTEEAKKAIHQSHHDQEDTTSEDSFRYRLSPGPLLAPEVGHDADECQWHKAGKQHTHQWQFIQARRPCELA